MNQILEDKINALENAKEYECWYLVKQPVAFDSLCYLVSFLKSYQEEENGGNLENYINDKIRAINEMKQLDISTNYRALRVASFFGLITLNSSGYSDASITDTFKEINNLCNGNYENIDLYKAVIKRQLEKIFISSSIDEENEGIRSGFRLYPILLLYKILIELGKAFGEYKITINEYRYLVATTDKYEKFLDTLLLINLLRKESAVNNLLERYKAKFDNRMIQALKLLDTIEVTSNYIQIRENCIIEVSDKVFKFENNYQIFESVDYLTFLGSTKSLFDLINIENSNEVLNDIGQLKFKTGLLTDFERNRIIFGAPGTGKSYKLKNDSKELIENTTGTYERVTFHPDYIYSNFVGTYKPVNNGGHINYEFVPGPFIRVYIDALKSGRTDSPQPHLLLIEEINRAKVASVFGDIFQLLDRDDDGVSEYEIHATEDIKTYLADKLGGFPSDFDKIRIPDNMFIWATMNSADQGVFPMDTAFKRRWNFEYLGINDNQEAKQRRILLGQGEDEVTVDWNRLRKAINEKLSNEYKINEDKLIGPYFLSNKVLITNDEDSMIADPEKFKESFKCKVIMYLYEDAAKQHKYRLFNGCENSRYSNVCEEFDKIGISIFGKDFKELYLEQDVF